MPKPAPLLSRNQKLLLCITCISLSLVLFLTHAWTPPPAIERPMAALFGRQKQTGMKKAADDPNSIEGRIPIGYWQDDGPGSAQSAIDENWDTAEREMVISYLKLVDDGRNDEVQVLQSWRGLSFCRLCEEANGNSCVGDNQYNWPQGFLHYIEKHHVKPPRDFIDHVRQQITARNK
jgi:hypothetical protein